MIECVELIDGWHWIDDKELHGPFPSEEAAKRLGREINALRHIINLKLAGVHSVAADDYKGHE